MGKMDGERAIFMGVEILNSGENGEAGINLQKNILNITKSNSSIVEEFKRMKLGLVL